MSGRLSTRRGIAALLVAAALLGAAATLVWNREVAPAFRKDDALEAAVMARRLAQGDGFTTGVIYPAELWLGADENHPAVRLPPLWSLVLAGPFAGFGAAPGVAYATVVAFFGALTALAAALAGVRGGLLAGAAAAVAVATSQANWMLGIELGSHTLYAAGVAAVLLLCALPAPAFAVGLACGLAFLTRYTGVLLLPVALGLVFSRDRSPRALALCGAGFLAVAAPWWIRNWVVTGDPFYTLLAWAPWSLPGATVHATVVFELEPDRASQFAADPLQKLATHLPLLLGYFPFANANLAALAGVLFGCLRRDVFCIAFSALAVLALLAAGLGVEARGADLAPYFPAMIALGAAAWLRYGGRLGLLALAPLLLATVLPRLPGDFQDLRHLRRTHEILVKTGEGEPPREARDALRSCLAGRPVVIAQEAPPVAWHGDAIAIYAPPWPQEFWRIVEEQPVAFAQRTLPGEISPERFEIEFTPLPECAPDLYARRRAAPRRLTR